MSFSNESIYSQSNELDDTAANTTTVDYEEPLSKRLKCSWKSPHPNWPVAFSTWGKFWEFHIYLFGMCFVLLAVLSLLCFILDVASRYVRHSNQEDHHPKGSPLSISLHGLIFTSTAARSINLLVDPYGTEKALPCPLGPVFWSCGWPGICCAFSILLLVLLETTQMSLAPPRFQRPIVLACIIIPSLIFVLVADMMVAYGGMKMALLICQVMFVVWGLLLCSGFGRVWWKIRQNLTSSSQDQSVHGRDNSRLRKLNVILISCALIGLAMTLINLYAISAARSVLLRPYFVKPVPWMAFQTSQRLLEIGICTLIVASQNRSSRWKKTEIGLGDDNSSKTKTEGVSVIQDNRGTVTA
ncbi:uncharacterized protein [Amphiura filiformis]|uniref:uncharacterized protein n=1 Tax=Amphiura filiformis TaxID=82378 RepID=UPI003B218D16